MSAHIPTSFALNESFKDLGACEMCRFSAEQIFGTTIKIIVALVSAYIFSHLFTDKLFSSQVSVLTLPLGLFPVSV